MKILIATDFSDAAKKAAQFAVALAKVIRAEILILNTYTAPSIADGPSSHVYELMMKEKKKLAEHNLDKLTKSIQRESYANSNENIKCSYTIALSDPASEIKRLAEVENIDLVVIGNIGEQEPHQFYKSTPVELMNHLPAPVLVIPERASFSDFKNVLYGFEGGNTDPSHIQKMARLIGPFHSKLFITHVNSKEKYVENEVMKLQKEFLSKGFSEVIVNNTSSNDVINGIDSVIESEKIDLLILTKHSREFLDGLFHHSVVKGEILGGKVPLLVFRT